MKLYIMRHGETAWNVEGRLQGLSLRAEMCRLRPTTA